MYKKHVLNRKLFVAALEETTQWDIIIIGGGATGLGIAVDSASRGYSTLLLEQSDFAKGTSSRSTKLVHGGVRYLAKGDVRLVYDALKERGFLLQNAPHIVRRQSFIIPCYSFFSKMKYLLGLKVYDQLSGRFSFGKSKFLNRNEILKRFPGINTSHLLGGVEYFDGQFDDARLAVNLAQTSAENGGVLLNYFKIAGLLKEGGVVSGVRAIDMESQKEYNLNAKVVINATGVFVDDVLQMDKPGRKPIVRPSQGIHLVVDKKFLNSANAMMIPETSDGRVLFAVPWHNHVLLGTTDTPLKEHSTEPVALEEEISFVLNTFKQYLAAAPTRKDVLSVFAGLRPLAAPQKDTGSTKEISRDHKLIVSDSGLITITGGKWTTYRKMAEETVNKAREIGSLPEAACCTRQTRIHGCMQPTTDSHLAIYGTDGSKIVELLRNQLALNTKLLDRFPYTEAEVVWAVRVEMARTIEDVLARRLRLLFLDARAALEVAPRVAAILAEELGYEAKWIEEQIKEFTKLASHYLLNPDIDQTEKYTEPQISKVI